MKDIHPRMLVLMKLEPALAEVYRVAASVKDGGGEYFCANRAGDYFCANEVWYGKLKPALLKAIGFYSENNLKASADYDLCYHTLYDLLPPCRNCGCL